MDRKGQLLMSVLGVFALVIVTVGASFAFFQYSRTGDTTNSIKSGDISFTYRDEKDVIIKNAFPVADTIGAVDAASAYNFSVVGDVSSTDVALKYSVSLISNTGALKINAGATSEQLADGTFDGRGLFTNDQIKANLSKTVGGNTTYVFGSANSGVKLSEIANGTFTAGLSTGAAVIASDQEVTSGQTVNYTLRTWISSDVDYSNAVYYKVSDNTKYDGSIYSEGGKFYTDSTKAEELYRNDDQTSTGKYNGYAYSLKVKVEANAVNNYGK